MSEKTCKGCGYEWRVNDEGDAIGYYEPSECPNCGMSFNQESVDDFF